ncbi:MAG: Altered inheritance of mitochondria protein 18 mitochondrial [Candelina mexicana]|nr:MAG: Altered inheritance of mitochondria protein 18 mitochondrial [Candelina mexicana]
MITQKSTRSAISLLRRTQPQCLHHPPPPLLPIHLPSKCLPIRFTSTRLSSSTSNPPPPHQESPREPLDHISFHRLETTRNAYYNRRSYYAFGGALLSMLATLAIIATADLTPERNDSPPNSSLDNLERGTPVVKGVTGGTEVRKVGEGPTSFGSQGERGAEGESVETGTSSVPTFPKSITLDVEEEGGVGGRGVEYQLIGLGIRTVSFLGIQVYVVGLYIATDDIASLQQALIRKIDPVATTLIKSEKDRLRDLLLDMSENGEKVWDEVLRECAARTVIRIVPTRNTDFGHLRDGWVRGITARSQKEGYIDEDFGKAIFDFKNVFSGGIKGSVPKGKTLLLARGKDGKLGVWFDEGKGEKIVRMGGVSDERIGRLVWLGYLAGKKVASEGARKSVVEGVMEFVERPIGTVATQVV